MRPRPTALRLTAAAANSGYAEELTKQIQVSGVLLETMFRRVAEQVSSRSGGRQEPWYSANVKGDFYFSASPTNLSLSNTPARIDAVAVEREYWDTIRSSSDPQDYKDYLQAYPNGAYAAIARAKIRQIETAKNTQPPASQPTNKEPSNSGGDKATDPVAIELGYWETIQNSIDPEDFKEYLERYPKGRFAGLAKRRMDSARVFAGKKSSNFNPSVKRNVPNPLPNPIIIFAGVESLESRGKLFTRYTYTVTNWEDYPDELFAAATTLPPCGNNTKASRTWVDFYEGSGKRLNGFCALDNLRGSGKLWFALYRDIIPPRGIYIEMTDRKTGKKYKSNLAETQ